MGSVQFQGPLTLGLLLRKILVAPLPPFHAGAKLPHPLSVVTVLPGDEFPQQNPLNTKSIRLKTLTPKPPES